jgi:hypothetical protein
MNGHHQGRWIHLALVASGNSSRQGVNRRKTQRRIVACDNLSASRGGMFRGYRRGAPSTRSVAGDCCFEQGYPANFDVIYCISILDDFVNVFETRNAWGGEFLFFDLASGLSSGRRAT